MLRATANHAPRRRETDNSSSMGGQDHDSSAASRAAPPPPPKGKPGRKPRASPTTATPPTGLSRRTTPDMDPPEDAETNGSGRAHPRCMSCGKSENPQELMKCCTCANVFHAQCANLPLAPEEGGNFFCRWTCFAQFHKTKSSGNVLERMDYGALAARVQAMLARGARPRRLSPGLPLLAPAPPLTTHQDGHQPPQQGEWAGSDRKRTQQTHSSSSSRRSSPSSSRPASADDGAATSDRHAAARHGGRRKSHNSSEPMDTSANVSPNQSHGRPFGAAPRTVPAIATVDLTTESSNARSFKRAKQGSGYHEISHTPSPFPVDGREMPSGYTSSSRTTPLETNDGFRPTSAQSTASTSTNSRERGTPFGPLPTLTDQQSRREASGSMALPALSSVRSLDKNHKENPGRLRGDDSMRFESAENESDLPPFGPSSRPSSSASGSTATSSHRHRLMNSNADDVAAQAYGSDGHGHQGAAPPSPAPYQANFPWLNPSTFPDSIYDRFQCDADDHSGVFRVDLSPVFAHKTAQLYQQEIDFFFRCFETPSVSLVVKGMASDLNQYVWAWPFILESCGNEAHFAFDHFQLQTNGENEGELEYMGELRLSMAAYNAYLEKYLFGATTKDVVVVTDHATKKAVNIVVPDSLIVLNGLVIAEHCNQLHTDLIKGFQWDVFAGGIHCLLQYVPQKCRSDKLTSPLLHFNFPGARSVLCDPGNGTTDRAYQVLVGTLELVIFERLDPRDRDEFHRILRRAGYDETQRSMLQDLHLQALQTAGFRWSAIVLQDGEFVHVNKGRPHFWRVLEPPHARDPVHAPCVFVSWEWVYQGVSQRGISAECWFSMKNATMAGAGWAFDPRRGIIEAAKCGLAIIRTGQFLSSTTAAGASSSTALSALSQLAFTTTLSQTDRDVIDQRQAQMILFLESILPCLDEIVEEEYELSMIKDDTEEVRAIFDDESLWTIVDSDLQRDVASTSSSVSSNRDYECGICGLELTNTYKQCLGCTMYARHSRPNKAYNIFRICMRCHGEAERHHFKPRAIHAYYEKLLCSEGHTGLLRATRRYQAERSYFKCRCALGLRCVYCGGCESCSCLCHTLFQTRFRHCSPESLSHLRSDVVDVIKWHKMHR